MPGHRNPPPSDVDRKGNIRGLIDYSYDKREAAAKKEKAKEKEKEQDKPKGHKYPTRATTVIKPEKDKKKKRKRTPSTVTSDETWVDEEDEDDDDDETWDSEEDEEDSEEDEEDSEDEWLDSEEEDDEDDRPTKKSPLLRSGGGGGGGALSLLLTTSLDGVGSGDQGPQKPKKYKLKNEPEIVRRFVKLAQTTVDPTEEDIDDDITYFKSLSPPAQERLLTKMKQKVDPVDAVVPLRFQILAKEVDPEVERVAMSKYIALQNMDPSTTEHYKTHHWVHGYVALPLGIYKDLPVRIEDGADACGKFVADVQDHMDRAIYGHDQAKLQILQFVSSWIANPVAAGNVLSLHGPPGVGKTTLIKDGIAKALGRPFHFISLGGATDASYLDGHSYTYEGSTWGRLVDILIKSKCMNPVIYFDELDKVSDTPKGEEIMNFLIHLTDQSQNAHIQDKYFAGIDLDFSRCLFIFSHNNNEKVNPVLRDRMFTVEVHGFDVKQKLTIAEQYLLPTALREVNLFEKIGVSREILTHIIENFTGEEKGVRELKRCIQTIVSKLNLLRFYNDPKRIPFAIPGFALPFTVRKEHVDKLLVKKSALNESVAHMYL